MMRSNRKKSATAAATTGVAATAAVARWQRLKLTSVDAPNEDEYFNTRSA